MTYTSESLILELIALTQSHIKQGETLLQKPEHQLNWKANEKSWSALEAIEHLNLYSDFYLPEIEKSIANSKTVSEINYKSGLLGNYFAKSMLPKDQLNKMKTFKRKNPNGSKLNKATLTRFLIQQKKTLEVLNNARNVSLHQIKVPTTLGKIIKLQLGDVLRIVIYHNMRHLVQARKSLKAQAN